MVKSSLLDWDPSAAGNTDVGGINIAEGCAAANINNAMREIMAQTKSGVDYKAVVSAKGANYTAVLNDNNAVIRFTGAYTLSLTAAATLGANWHCWVHAYSGDVIIDPNGSETINGATTITVASGSSAFVYCTGTAFFAIVGVNLAAATSDNTFDDTDELLYLTSTTPKRGTLSGLVTSIFKTARTIADARFTGSSFGLVFGSYRAIFDGTLGADRTYTLPDASITIAKEWTELAASATTSGASVDWTGIPSGINEIEMWFKGVSVTSTQHMTVQIGTGGSPTTSGYSAGTGIAGANVAAFSSAGFVLYSNASTLAHTGLFRLFRNAGTNEWMCSVAMLINPSAGTSMTGGGTVTLSGTLDNIRLTRDSGSQTFDAGSVVVRYR